jgi:DNA-binding transcriptional LysR family regulator
MIEVARLLVLREVARGGSLTAAARNLHYSQPAISQQIKKLEAEVGASVLTREARGIRLTAVGAKLVEHANVIFDEIAAANSLRRTSANEGYDQVHITGFAGFGPRLLPGVLDFLSRESSEGREPTVRHTEAGSATAIADMSSGDADIAVISSSRNLALDDAQLASERVVHDKGVLVVGRAHPLANATKPVSLAQLKGELWFTHGIDDRTSLVEACRRNGYAPRIRCGNAEPSLALTLVGRNMGISIQSASGLSEIMTDQVSMVPLEDEFFRDVYLVRSRAEQRQSVKQVYDALCFALQETSGSAAETSVEESTKIGGEVSPASGTGVRALRTSTRV